jgi:hypothetical protein
VQNVQRRHPSDSGRGAPADKTVVLHVGAPKTGTTYLQQVMWRNRHRLAERGIGYPLASAREHFAATMDLRRAAWGGRHDPAWDGAWEQVAARTRDWPGTRVVISNELLGAATAEQIDRAMASVQPAQVEVVFTARDLARQLPSEWQEQVRHNKAVALDDMLDDLVALGDTAELPPEAMFWRLHDPVRVLRPWAEAVGADHVRLVTVPPSGAPRDLLWRRFADAIGVDPAGLDLDVGDANPSLGLVEAELLRRTNELLRSTGTASNPGQRRYLVRQVLGHRSERRTIALPPRHAAWARKRSAEVVDGIRVAGYHVIGDLADLHPSAAVSAEEPNSVTERELLDAALDALAGLLARPAPSAAPANRGSS